MYPALPANINPMALGLAANNGRSEHIQNTGDFIFRVFAAGANGDLVLNAAPGLLDAQEYRAATRQIIRQHVASGQPQWWLTLKIEDTEPFQIAYGQLGQYAAASRRQGAAALHLPPTAARWPEQSVCMPNARC